MPTALRANTRHSLYVGTAGYDVAGATASAAEASSSTGLQTAQSLSRDVLLRAMAKSRCRGPSSAQLEDGGKYTAAARPGAGAHSCRADAAPAMTSNPSRNEDRMGRQARARRIVRIHVLRRRSRALSLHFGWLFSSRVAHARISVSQSVITELIPLSTRSLYTL